MSTTNDKPKHIVDAFIPSGPITKEHALGINVDEHGNMDPGVKVVSSTTNDEQGKYGEQPKREPLLSDDVIRETFRVRHDVEPDGYAHGIGAINVANRVRGFYEAKIASGELMVVKTAKGAKLPPCGIMWGCEHCGYKWTGMDNYCPGCGAKIVEA